MDAYEEGRLARLEGKSLEDNPYLENCELWEMGWKSGEKKPINALDKVLFVAILSCLLLFFYLILV